MQLTPIHYSLLRAALGLSKFSTTPTRNWLPHADEQENPTAAQELIEACGGERNAIQVWIGSATQTTYATLAPIVVRHAPTDATANRILADAAIEVASIARALDPSETLPLALCGGLGAPLRAYLPPELLARSVAPCGDAANGALRMIALHLKGK